MHDGAPSSAAPTWWIEPRTSLATSVPSARIRAVWRPFSECSTSPGGQQPALDELAEGDARLGALRGGDGGALGVERADRGDARLGDRAVFRLALDADEAPPQPLRHRPGGAGAEEGVEHDVARPGRGDEHPVQQRLGLLRRVRLVAGPGSSAVRAPVQSGIIQSERICTPSFSAFIAS